MIGDLIWACGLIVVGIAIYRDNIKANKKIAEIQVWRNQNRIEEEAREKWWQENKIGGHEK